MANGMKTKEIGPQLGDGSNTVSVAFTGTTARVELPSGTTHVRLVSLSSACFIRFGGSTVEAASTDIPFPAGVEYLEVPGNSTYLAAIQVSAGGTLYATKVIDG